MSLATRIGTLEAATTAPPYRAVCEQWELPDGTLSGREYLIYARQEGDVTGGAHDQASFEAFAARHPVVLLEHTIWTIPAGER